MSSTEGEMTKNEALKVVGEIESLIEKFGAPNDQALSHLKRLVFLLCDASNETYFTEKLDSVAHWADRGFSTRKFATYSGGAEGVRSFARSDCKALKGSIRKWPGDP